MARDLKHTPADITRRLLVVTGHGTAPSSAASWPVYVHKEQDTPDNCVTVYNTSPRDMGRYMHGDLNRYYGVQIRVRSSADGTYDAETLGRQKAEDIIQSLAIDYRQESIIFDGATYLIHAFVSIQGPQSLGADASNSNRWLTTLNAELVVQQTE